LIDLQYVGGAILGESPRANGFGYRDRKIGLHETLFRVRQTEVREHIAAPFLDRDSFIQGLLFSPEPLTIWSVLLRLS